MKMPPIEKIPEAWSALVDGRVEIEVNSAAATNTADDAAVTETADNSAATKTADGGVIAGTSTAHGDDTAAGPSASRESANAAVGVSTAHVTSSDGAKEYLVEWRGDVFYSNDNATYWQGYPGYPVLAVLMKRGRLPYDAEIATHFKGIDWHAVNAHYKRDYAQALASVIEDLPESVQNVIHEAMQETYVVLEALNLTLTRKKLSKAAP